MNAIEIKNNKARHNLSNLKYRQMEFRSVDGAVVGTFWSPLVKQKWCTATRGRLHEVCFDLSQFTVIWGVFLTTMGKPGLKGSFRPWSSKVRVWKFGVKYTNWNVLHPVNKKSCLLHIVLTLGISRIRILTLLQTTGF